MLYSFYCIEQCFQISRIKLYLLGSRSCNFLTREEALEDVNKEIRLRYVSLERRRSLLEVLRQILSHCISKSTSTLI